MQTLRINEIFYSIQGEGLYVGAPTVFVRTQGCNIRCAYCDTGYAISATSEGRDMNIPEIRCEILKIAPTCPMICLTGGEPLVQPNAVALLKALNEAGYTTEVETNGSVNLAPFITTLKTEGVQYNMDVKLPSSGEADSLVESNLHVLRSIDQIKFVVQDRQDFEYASVLLKTSQRIKARIFFSPVWDKCEPRDLVEWVLADYSLSKTRVQLQIHKYIWPPLTRAV